MLQIFTRVHTRGPIFDGRAHHIFEDFSEELEDDGAEFVLDHIKRTFHSNFKQPTGYYESHVFINNSVSGAVVEDGGMAGPVYGPWLEGVGSRNATTRFKGYGAFRKAAQALERRIEGMGHRLMNRNYIHRL